MPTFLEFNDSYRKQARLTLALHESAAILWKLPWEYLHDGNDFVALTGRFLLGRKPEGLAEIDPEPTALPLKVLIIIAAPSGVAELNTEHELALIQEALDDGVRAGHIDIDYLEDATLDQIDETVRTVNPHVIHYTGHGGYDREKQASFLALENDDGKLHRAYADELAPIVREADNLRLLFLSGCQTAQTGADDAFAGVATGLLNVGVPAVIAMQFSILDSSATNLAKRVYQALANGETPAGALYRGRQTLRRGNPGFDWGIPSLYLRAQRMQLVDPTATVAERTERIAHDVGGLPLPPHFVGRKQELRQLRRVLRDGRVNAAFVQGIGGMGKSTTVAKLIARPGATIQLDDVLVIRCHEIDPLEIPQKIFHFWAGQGKAGHAEAGQLLARHAPGPR